MKKILNILKIVYKVGYWVILLVLILVAGLTAVSTLKIPGNYKLFVVQSGSMEPKIKRMGVVAVKPFSEYKEGDVITAADPGNPKVTVTHRIVEIEKEGEQIFYITKGDANQDPDTEKRPKEYVLGKVIFSLPFIGYPLSFAKTQTGLIVMIIIPAAIIIYSELISIKNEALRLIKERRKRKLSIVEKAEVAVGKEIMAVENEVKEVEKEILKAAVEKEEKIKKGKKKNAKKVS